MPKAKIQEHLSEVRIVYAWDTGETAGSIRAICVERREYVVDDLGRIVKRVDRGREDHPVDVDRKVLDAILGPELPKAIDERDAARTLLADRTNALKMKQEAIEKISAERDALTAKLAAAAAVEKPSDG